MLPRRPRQATARGEHPVKVGCIGLGDIAQKAYLPVLGALPGVDLHLQTRTPATLTRVADGLHLPAERRHADLDSLLAQDLDAAFVHAPTAEIGRASCRGRVQSTVVAVQLKKRTVRREKQP